MFTDDYPGRGTSPSVFIHGLGTASAIWKDCLGAVANSIAVELPGYAGRPLVGGSALADYSAAVARSVGLLKHSEIHLVGHSMGSLIAASIAEQHPNRVKSLVLVSPALGFGSVEEAERKRILRTRLAQLDRRSPLEWASDNVDLLLRVTSLGVV